MKRLLIRGGCLVVLVISLLLWYMVASDYGDGVASGTYQFAENGESSTLVLKPDHSFQQELIEHGEVKHATGTWRRIGEGALRFQRSFYPYLGRNLGPMGPLVPTSVNVSGFSSPSPFLSITCCGTAESTPLPLAPPPVPILETNPECRRR
jgi:hypothetical protein